MEVPILIVDKGNQDMGIRAEDLSVPFYFHKDALLGFWIDPDIEDSTKMNEIVFYVGHGSFRTPYKKKVAEEFYEIIKKRS